MIELSNFSHLTHTEGNMNSKLMVTHFQQMQYQLLWLLAGPEAPGVVQSVYYKHQAFNNVTRRGNVTPYHEVWGLDGNL
jgi:hypothetical protein